jgi:hypothetical protein
MPQEMEMEREKMKKRHKSTKVTSQKLKKRKSYQQRKRL